MPDLINRYIYFKANKNYKTVKKSRIYLNLQLSESIALDTQPKLCATLRQICNIENKIEYLKLIIDNMTSNDNLLIFYNFDSEYNNIVNHISVDYTINGKIKNYPKKEEFNLQNKKITLVQIQAGGTAIDLQYNNLVIFYSPTYSYQDYDQCM